MSAAEALRAARASGIELRVEGDDLVLEASTPPPASVLELLSSNKHGVVALLRLSPDGCPAEDWRGFFDDRAAIREVDGELPRVAAEALANRDTTAALRPPHQDGGRASVPSNSKPIARTSIARADGGKEDEHQAFFAKRIQLDRADERSDHDGTTPERVGERPVEHFCWCGKEAHFGFGVRLLKGRLGTWYCAEHRLEEGEAK